LGRSQGGEFQKGCAKWPERWMAPLNVAQAVVKTRKSGRLRGTKRA
jgi:hypothetical protein